MGDNFTLNGCGSLAVNNDYHPLAVALFAAYQTFGTYFPPQIKTAYNNIVKAGIVVPFPAFDTDGSGAYQSDLLIGCRIVTAIGGINPMDIAEGQITLDPETGTIQSIYGGQTHVLSIGYFITGLPQLMPELEP